MTEPFVPKRFFLRIVGETNQIEYTSANYHVVQVGIWNFDIEHSQVTCTSLFCNAFAAIRFIWIKHNRKSRLTEFPYGYEVENNIRNKKYVFLRYVLILGVEDGISFYISNTHWSYLLSVRNCNKFDIREILQIFKYSFSLNTCVEAQESTNQFSFFLESEGKLVVGFFTRNDMNDWSWFLLWDLIPLIFFISCNSQTTGFR